MCLAIPGKIIKIKDHQAWVQYPSQINQALIAEISTKVGDYVMVQMGIIIKKITKKEAKLMLDSWSEKK